MTNKIGTESFYLDYNLGDIVCMNDADGYNAVDNRPVVSYPKLEFPHIEKPKSNLEEYYGMLEKIGVFKQLDEDINPVNDPINHPSHYSPGSVYEVINIIEHYNLGFCMGNTLKYILRAGNKDPNKYKEDLKKAIWYIEREISNS